MIELSTSNLSVKYEPVDARERGFEEVCNARNGAMGGVGAEEFANRGRPSGLDPGVGVDSADQFTRRRVKTRISGMYDTLAWLEDISNFFV
ncbi:hypothetical protein GCM10020255_064170 [Rhodococcus baikonurensis]|jgi:hypothetical protein